MHKMVDGKRVELSKKEEEDIKKEWEKDRNEYNETKLKKENHKKDKINNIKENIKYLKDKGFDDRMILILYDDARKLEGYVEDPEDDINPTVRRRGKK